MSKVMVIAEAGVNHNGDLNLAKKLVDAAVEARADAVKFQTFKTNQLVTSDARKAQYQIQHTKNSLSQFKMLQELELRDDDFRELYYYCTMKKIKFLSSPFDEESIDLLDILGLDTIKVPSGEITNYFYLKKIAKLNKNIILSTGMATIDEIAEALELLEEGSKSIVLLHCTSSYPTDLADVNLKAMCTLKQVFHKKVGFSDHTLGIEAAVVAVSLGACIIEKHFTMDRSLPGPDHIMSLEPDELKTYIKSIRNTELVIGDGIKRPTKTELENREFVRKSLIAAKDIKQGEIFTEKNLCAKRCGYGISPMRIKDLLGSRATRSYEKEERIKE